jgi:polyisoprenoid-binding protein YceI
VHYTSPSRPRFTAFALGATAILSMSLAMPGPAHAAAAAKVGGKCTKVNAKSGSLVCVKKLGKLVWSRVTPTTTKATASSSGSSGAAGSSGATTTVAASGAAPSAAAPAGIEGTWTPTAKSLVGYRVKEVLVGQSTEGVGRTSAVTGKMVIAGTKVTSVDLTADLTKLESDSNRRDGQVQNRILETAKFPTATLKLTAPIDFSTVPGDKVEITAKASASLTVHGVTKTVSFDVVARRNGAAIEVNGSIPFVMTDFNIPDPSVADLVTTEQKGLLEFLVVFER